MDVFIHGAESLNRN